MTTEQQEQPPTALDPSGDLSEAERRSLERPRRRLNPKVRWSLLLFLLACAVYAAVRRHWTDVGVYGAGWSFFLAFWFLVGEGYIYIEGAKTRRERAVEFFRFALMAVPLSVIFFPLGLAAYGLFASGGDLLRFAAVQVMSAERYGGLIALGTACLGALLFTFRLKYRCVYGFSEACVGLVVATNQSGGGASLYLAILTAGVYLVVRGLDNIHQGWKADSDAVARAAVDAVQTRVRSILSRTWIIDPPVAAADEGAPDQKGRTPQG